MKQIFMLSMLLVIAPAALGRAAQYDFGVYLDGKRIGEHTFVVAPAAGGGYTVNSNARFEVKVLMVPVYRYRHSAQEVWEGGCLQSITSETVVNGRTSALRGRLEAERFELQVEEAGTAQSRSLPACVSTFAYWDAGTLQQQERLLNSQTGTYESVTFARQKEGQVAISSEKFEINLQYDADKWRGLSTLRDGRRLEYRPESPV